MEINSGFKGLKRQSYMKISSFSQFEDPTVQEGLAGVHQIKKIDNRQ